MDASKAVQALRQGDFLALLGSLDADRTAHLTGEDFEIMICRFGQVVVKPAESCNAGHAHLEMHAFPDPVVANEAFDDLVSQVQFQRGAMLAAGGDVAQLRVDGTLVPAPELSINDMLAGLGGRRVMDETRPAQATVPDDLSGVDWSV